MKTDITEVFCEIISGIGGVFVATLLVVSFRAITFCQVWETARSNNDIVDLAGLLIVFYLVGVVVDAVGLVFDELLGDRICKDETTKEQIERFWKNVDEHVLAYRDHVWTYYFCYRNLLMLCFPAAILWPFALRGLGLSIAWVLIPIILTTLFAVVLYRAMRVLLKLYYDITQSF